MIQRWLYTLARRYYIWAPRWLVHNFGVIWHVVVWLKPRGT